MWGGVSVAAASLLCWALYGRKRIAYALALLATLGLLTWTSDQGGKLTHGETFLTEHSPESLRRWLGGERPSADRPNEFLCDAGAADLRREMRSLPQFRKV